MYTSIPTEGPPQSAERLVYEMLKREIIAGSLPGGSQLAQAEIANRLGVSRIPVRDAIRHLAVAGLVTVSPNRRAYVTVLNDEDLDELFQIRASLEGLAARNAASRFRQKELTQLADLVEKMNEAEAKLEEWAPLHDEFHRRIYSLAMMPRLSAEIERLRQQLQPWVRVLATVQNVAELKIGRHRDLVSVLCTLDPDRCEQAVREHVLQASVGIRETIRSARRNNEPVGPAEHTTTVVEPSDFGPRQFIGEATQDHL